MSNKHNFQKLELTWIGKGEEPYIRHKKKKPVKTGFKSYHLVTCSFDDCRGLTKYYGAKIQYVRVYANQL